MKRHILSLFVLALLVFLAVGSIDSKSTSSSPRPSPSPAPRPPSPPREHRPPTADETERMNRALVKARDKLSVVIATLQMSGDLIVTDDASISDGQVSITLNVELTSRDARDAYGSGKLRSNTYPGFKRIYEDAMNEAGFSSVWVTTSTDFR